jgi:hypothetical protein
LTEGRLDRRPVPLAAVRVPKRLSESSFQIRGVVHHAFCYGRPVGHLIGYARVSTADQNPALQLDALDAAGCLKVYTDRASGGAVDRPELARALDDLRPEDTLVVWRLDRLGRSLRWWRS